MVPVANWHSKHNLPFTSLEQHQERHSTASVEKGAFCINLSVSSLCLSSVPSKTEENELIAKVVQITPGVCIHNGILHKNKEEWTIDSCTECTCQVGFPTFTGPLDTNSGVEIKQKFLSDIVRVNLHRPGCTAAGKAVFHPPISLV